MKKRIFGTLLMGAVVVSSMSTFVSCKDYDDDINSMQTQVNSLSSKVTETETSIRKLVTDLDAAYKQADSDLKAAYAAADAALKSDLQKADNDLVNAYTAADAANLAAAQTAIDNAKKALQEVIDNNYKTLEAKAQAQDEAIAKAQADANAALQVLPSKADAAALEAAITRIANLETKVSALDATVQQAVKDIEALQTAIKAQEAALAVVEKLANDNVTAIGKNADDIKAAVASINSVRSELTSDLNTLSGKLDAAKSELQAAIELSETNLTSKVTEVNTKVEEIRTEIISSASRIDSKYEVITVMISKSLRSLVYMPTLYVDGIETIEYNYLRDSLLNRVNVDPWNRTEGATPTKTIADVKDYVLPATIKDFVFGPAWPVYYHQNPSVASTAYKNIVGYYAYDVETVTRATDMPVNCATKWGITSPEKYVNGDQLFEGGAVLTAGLQIKNPHTIDNVKDNPNTSYATHPNLHSNNDVIVALQASSDINGKDTVITSDYAMLMTEKIWLEGLVWRKGTTTGNWPTYWYKDNQRIQNFWNNDRGYAATTPYATTTQNGIANHDELCPWTTQIVHVWDNPKEALEHPADIELFVNDLDGVDILQYMGVHFVHEAITKAGLNRQPGTWAWNDAELQHFGLRWFVDVVDYTVTDRTRPENIIRTHDSRYVKLDTEVKDANGKDFANATTIHAQDVIDRDGLNETYDDVLPADGSRASVGREPLIRIRLYHGSKDAASDFNTDAYDKGPKEPILDGYIRVRISQPELKELAYPEFQKETFDLCNALNKETNWTLFNQKVLAEGLDLEREQFNALYNPELSATAANLLIQYSKPRNYSNLSEGDQGAEFYGYYNESVPVRNMKREKVGDKYFITEGQVGTIELRDNYQGTTNDAYLWTISEEEAEFITHDLPVGTEVTVERFVHYTGHFEGNRGAKYDDIFIKLTRTIVRKEIEVAKLKNKNDDYYRYEKFIAPFTGSATNYLSGYEAVAWNAPYPKDADANNLPPMMTVPFENNINNAFLDNAGQNNPKFDGNNIGTWKYYFTPIEVEIKAQDGTVYVLTPRRGSGDTYFNKFMCAYVKDNHQFHITLNGADKTDVAANRSTGALDNNLKANEVENNKIIAECAIKYNNNAAGTASNAGIDGVFANDTLYAVAKGAYGTQREYEPIVIMDQKTGIVTLLHESYENKWLTINAQPLAGDGIAENTISELVLNAIGYNEEVYEVGQNPIHEQLRAWTGVICKYKNCDIAMQMSDAAENKKDDNTFATWMNGWERPINVYAGDDKAIDAKNNGNYIYLVDILQMYDWRGYSLNSNNEKTWDATQVDWNNEYSRRGGMFGKNYWLWAYYGIKGFDIDVRRTKVETTLHWGDPSPWPTLSEVSHNLEFFAGYYDEILMQHIAQKNQAVPVRFNLRTPDDYSYAHKNNDLINKLGFNTPDEDNGYNVQKAKFGYIFYTNNGDNVQDFFLAVPIRVHYDWGWIDTKVKIKVGGSIGNLD